MQGRRVRSRYRARQRESGCAKRVKKAAKATWAAPSKYLCFAEERHCIRIYANFELEDFPFDKQEFHIDLELTGIDVATCKFVPYSNLAAFGMSDVITADCVPDRCVFEDMDLLAPRGAKSKSKRPALKKAPSSKFAGPPADGVLENQQQLTDTS